MSNEEKITNEAPAEQASTDVLEPIKNIEACIESVVFAAGYPVPYQRLAEAAPSLSTLNGTWTYQSASFSYLGNSPLADIAIAQIDPIVVTTLKQLNVTPGSVTLRLSGGKGTLKHGDNKLEGTYVYTRSMAAIVAETTLDGKRVKASGYVRYESGELTVMLDARELITAMTTVLPELKKDQNIILLETLLKDLKDVYAVGKFTK